MTQTANSVPRNRFWHAYGAPMSPQLPNILDCRPSIERKIAFLTGGLGGIGRECVRMKIINFSSVGGGIATFPGFRLSDGMSNAAVAALSRQLAAELTDSLVNVFAICPGATDTKMFQEGSLDHLSASDRRVLGFTLFNPDALGGHRCIDGTRCSTWPGDRTTELLETLRFACEFWIRRRNRLCSSALRCLGDRDPISLYRKHGSSTRAISI